MYLLDLEDTSETRPGHDRDTVRACAVGLWLLEVLALEVLALERYGVEERAPQRPLLCGLRVADVTGT